MKQRLTKQDIFTLKLAGMAGQGIKSAGIMYARFANRSGCYIYNYIEYPSIIRGGHNVMQINISREEVQGPSNKTTGSFRRSSCDSSGDKHLPEWAFRNGLARIGTCSKRLSE